jgi:hypothetical protein
MKALRLFSWVYAATLLLGGCSGSGDTPASDASSPDADPSEALFDPTKIVTVAIEMAPDDWELVRQDERNFLGNDLGCPTGPFTHTYTWKRATVTVNGQRVEEAGIRKKGFIGSVNSVKPSLKIKFDKYVQGQILFGKERLTLNNNVQDPSQMVQCLFYGLARAAGIAAPRCNFAEVSVNGQLIGLYSNVESVKKRFLARHFADTSGDLYEGTVSDFRDGWMESFEPKTTETDPSLARIKAVTETLKLPDKLLSALSEVVEIDNFATFWALNSLSNNADTYFTKGNNFFVYFDPSANNRMYFIPWGADAAFYGSSGMSVQAKPMLARRLYLLPAGQAKFVGALKSLLDGVWNEARLKTEIDRMKQLIEPGAARDPYLESGGMSEKGMNFAAAVEALRDFVASRRAAAQQIIDTPPAWTEPLQERNCSGAEGSFKATGSFATTYGSLGSTDPFAVGSGSIELAEDGKGVSVVTVGAQAGADEKTPDRTVVNVIAQQNDGSHRTASFSISNAAFVAGATITFDKSGDLAGVLTGEVPNVKTWVVGALSSGSITLTKAGTDEGQAVEGTFAASWGDAGDK